MAEAPDHRAAEDRALRWWAAVVGVPLLLTAVLPIELRGDWYVGITFALEIRAHALLLLPLTGLVLLVAAIVGKLGPVVRALLALLAAVTVLWVVHSMAEHPRLAREILGPARRVDRDALTWLFLSPILGIAADIVMSRRVRRKRWGLVALLAWLHVLARLAVPLRVDFDTSPIGALIDGEEEAIVIVLPLALLASVGFLRGFLRLAWPRDRLERAKPGWAWLAAVSAVGPTLLFTLLVGAFAIGDKPEALPVVLGCAALMFALLAGVPLGIAHGGLLLVGGVADWAGRLRSDEPKRRRGALLSLIPVALLLLVLGGRWAWHTFGPDPREAEIVAMSERVATAVVESGMGRAYDEDLHGGYSSFDLRGSRGALAAQLPDGAAVDVELVAFEMTAVAEGVRFRTRIVVHDGAVRWAAVELDPHIEQTFELEMAGDAFVGAATRTADGLLGSCLPLAGAEQLAALPPQWGAEVSTVAEACERASPDGHGFDDGEPRGQLGAYAIAVRSGEHRLVLTGGLYNDAGRLWVGKLEVAEP